VLRIANESLRIKGLRVLPVLGMKMNNPIQLAANFKKEKKKEREREKEKIKKISSLLNPSLKSMSAKYKSTYQGEDIIKSPLFTICVFVVIPSNSLEKNKGFSNQQQGIPVPIH
jgi:hypothetical protein